MQPNFSDDSPIDQILSLEDYCVLFLWEGEGGGNEFFPEILGPNFYANPIYPS